MIHVLMGLVEVYQTGWAAMVIKKEEVQMISPKIQMCMQWKLIPFIFK